MIAFPARFLPVTTLRNFVIDSLGASEAPNERALAPNDVNTPRRRKLRRAHCRISRSMTSPRNFSASASSRQPPRILLARDPEEIAPPFCRMIEIPHAALDGRHYRQQPALGLELRSPS
jgi:hypothetical protein